MPIDWTIEINRKLLLDLAGDKIACRGRWIEQVLLIKEFNKVLAAVLHSHN